MHPELTRHRAPALNALCTSFREILVKTLCAFFIIPILWTRKLSLGEAASLAWDPTADVPQGCDFKPVLFRAHLSPSPPPSKAPWVHTPFSVLVRCFPEQLMKAR